MTLEFFNTLTGKKEFFQSLVPRKVGLYVCGITPYDETHLGHARCYVVFDLLKRVLEKNGFSVRHIQNFTDVDDKIILRANESNVDPISYPDPFIQSFHKYMALLNVKPADEYPRVTTHMPEIIRTIEQLVLRGLAYELEGSVYYAVRKFEPYGRLSKRRIDELESGARIDVNEKKNDPLDFALWKKAKKGEPSWDSPWGAGRPGWHIECSAMSMKYLGEEFDIHGGGQDLIFPHHENEIAQSVGATGKPFARTWIHNGFVTVNQEKMSKSLGNFFTLKDILAKYDPMVVRYFLLGQHYRSPLDFSDQGLNAAGAAWSGRVVAAYNVAQAWETKGSSTLDPTWDPDREPIFREFLAYLANDLNTSGALGVMNQVCSNILQRDGRKPSSSSRDEDFNTFSIERRVLEGMCSVLGLRLPKADEWSAEIMDLVQQREQARKNKEWARSDQVREELKKRGALVEDTPSGPRLKRIL